MSNPVAVSGAVGFPADLEWIAAIGHRFLNSDLESEALRETGIRVVNLGHLGREEAVEAAAGASAILLGVSFALDAAALQCLPRCRVIVRYGVGVDNIDLAAGHLAGAGLDVFAVEPPAPDGIASLPNVWGTPHVPYVSDDAVRDLRRLAAEEAGRVLRGEQPRNAVVRSHPTRASHG